MNIEPGAGEIDLLTPDVLAMVRLAPLSLIGSSLPGTCRRAAQFLDKLEPSELDGGSDQLLLSSSDTCTNILPPAYAPVRHAASASGALSNPLYTCCL